MNPATRARLPTLLGATREGTIGAKRLGKLGAATVPNTVVNRTSPSEIQTEEVPAPWTAPFRVRNTFIDSAASRESSLEPFILERAVHTCPSRHIGRLNGLFHEVEHEIVSQLVDTPKKLMWEGIPEGIPPTPTDHAMFMPRRDLVQNHPNAYLPVRDASGQSPMVHQLPSAVFSLVAMDACRPVLRLTSVIDARAVAAAAAPAHIAAMPSPQASHMLMHHNGAFVPCGYGLPMPGVGPHFSASAPTHVQLFGGHQSLPGQPAAYLHGSSPTGAATVSHLQPQFYNATHAHTAVNGNVLPVRRGAWYGGAGHSGAGHSGACQGGAVYGAIVSTRPRLRNKASEMSAARGRKLEVSNGFKGAGAFAGFPQAGPAPGSAELPSIGSANHGSGRCKPCAFFHIKGCENGAVCRFCHFCEQGEKKRRAKDKLAKRRVVKQIQASRQAAIAPCQATLPTGQAMLPAGHATLPAGQATPPAVHATLATGVQATLAAAA